MSPPSLKKSLERARRRFGEVPTLPGRRQRSDRGRSRLDPRVLACIAASASGRERPPMREMLRSITGCCDRKGCRPPSRATVYNLLPSLPGASYLVRELPEAVREALYNLDADSVVPGRQVAFYCFDYGDLRAMSFAAGMPWLAVYQALRMPGYRKKSRGLAEAAAQARRI